MKPRFDGREQESVPTCYVYGGDCHENVTQIVENGGKLRASAPSAEETWSLFVLYMLTSTDGRIERVGTFFSFL